MADNHPHLEAGHEEHDVNVMAVTRFGIGLTLTIIVSVFTLWGLFTYLKNQAATELGTAPPVTGFGVNAAKLPPQPRLQDAPVLDLKDMRAAEDQVLDHYGWVDRDHGVVRIPIDRAMDLLAQRGLPGRPPAGKK